MLTSHADHAHDLTATGTCRTCRRSFGEDALVWSYGRDREPHCVRCALVAAGTTPSDQWLATLRLSA